MLPSLSHRTTVLFAVNLVYWSLFFEVIANIAYALLRRYLNGRVLLCILVFLGCTLVVWRLHHNDLNNGATWPDFGIGMVRAFFGIFAGIALFRYRNDLTASALSLPAPSVLIIACLPMLMPEMGRLDSVIDLMALLGVFPLTIALLSKAVSRRSTGLLLALGASSYPLYLLHFQARQYAEIVLRYHPEKYAPVAGLVTLALLIPVSILLEKRADEPIRKRLTARWVKRAVAQARSAASTLPAEP
jgi:peptidoglycan/LPS O-acetylase OafA/YrhL